MGYAEHPAGGRDTGLPAACPILMGPFLTSRGCSPQVSCPRVLSAELTVISAEMRPYLSPSACHPCLQIQPGTSARPDQIFIPQCCLGGQTGLQKALCSIRLWKPRGVCRKAGPQQHCLSEEGSGRGSRGRKAPTAGLQVGVQV